MKPQSQPPLQEAAPTDPCIGMFDSGVGGLSILKAVHARLPRASIVYLGDVAYSPYGERPVADVAARCETIVAHLVERGSRLIVVACNTATVMVIDQLRDRWPALQFVGVEPGVKPAAAHSRKRRIAVMATPVTAGSDRLRKLIRDHAGHTHVHLQPCPGLATAIETSALGSETLSGILTTVCKSIQAADVDQLVLGCTHYAFVREQIRVLLGDSITIVDTSTAIADQTASLWRQPPGQNDTGHVRVLSTGATETMQVLLKQCGDLGAIEVERIAL
jgi:glutamate racemase